MIERIFYEVKRFESVNNERPKFLYIGKCDLQRLMSESSNGLSISYDAYSDKTSFNGLEVLVVDTDYHFNVG